MKGGGEDKRLKQYNISGKAEDLGFRFRKIIGWHGHGDGYFQAGRILEG